MRFKIFDTVGQLFRVTTVCIHSPNIGPFPCAVGDKNYIAAIGCHGWLLVDSGINSELYLMAAVLIHDPDVSIAGRTREIHDFAVGRPGKAVRSFPLVAGGNLSGTAGISTRRDPDI